MEEWDGIGLPETSFEATQISNCIRDLHTESLWVDTWHEKIAIIYRCLQFDVKKVLLIRKGGQNSRKLPRLRLLKPWTWIYCRQHGNSTGSLLIQRVLRGYRYRVYTCIIHLRNTPLCQPSLSQNPNPKAKSSTVHQKPKSSTSSHTIPIFHSSPSHFPFILALLYALFIPTFLGTLNTQ